MTNTCIKYLWSSLALLAFSLMISPHAFAIVNGEESTGKVDESKLKSLAASTALEKITSEAGQATLEDVLAQDTAFKNKFTNKFNNFKSFADTGIYNLTLKLRGNYIAKTDFGNMVNKLANDKFNNTISKLESDKIVRCNEPPSCESLGFTQTSSECAGKLTLKCPTDTSKLYCVGEEEQSQEICHYGLYAKTAEVYEATGKNMKKIKYCCPSSNTISARGCLLARYSPAIQAVYANNIRMQADLTRLKTDLTELKKLDIDALKVISNNKNIYASLKDIGAGNAVALKGDINMNTLSSKFSTTVSKVSEMADCSYHGPQICTSVPWQP